MLSRILQNQRLLGPLQRLWWIMKDSISFSLLNKIFLLLLQQKKVIFHIVRKSSLLIRIQKLRDVLQEREGTSLNYIKVLFNYIEQFSRSILIFVYLCLFWTILVYLGASQCISVYLCLTRSILVYLSLSWSILDYIRLHWTTLNYLELSWTISDNL